MILFDLFTTFLLLGAFSFGGGIGSMELIRSRVVTMRGWMTNAEFTDIISISEMTPGPLGINIASFVGARTAGIPGTIVATFSYVLPAIFIVMIMARIFFRCRNLKGVQGVLKGLRPAIAAMVLAAAVSLSGTAWWNGIRGDESSLSTEELRKQLLAIKGVGEETADVILVYALYRPSFIIDAYTRRLLSRLGFQFSSDTEIRSFFEEGLEADAGLYGSYHWLVLEHCKAVCRKTPCCDECRLRTICPYCCQ